jgi:hypothetical protein
MNTPSSKSSWTPTESALVGCGSLVLVFAICCGVAVFFAVRNARTGQSSDPQQIRSWLKEEVKTEPPKGYECVRGSRFNAIGSIVCTILVAPPDAKIDAKNEFDPDKTVFVLMRAPMADQAAPDPKGDASKGRTIEKTENYIFDVAGRKATGTRREVTEQGVKRAEYQLGLRKNVLFFAAGPAGKFDKKAMDDFLGTMVLDQPFDLPTEQKPAAKKN